MKNIMIDGAMGPLACRVAESLSHHPEVERLVGIEPGTSSKWSARIEWIAAEPDHRRLLEFMREYEIDTVIQCGLAPDRSGALRKATAADVIGTMHLGATIGHPGCPVRSWVVVSSSAVYPVDSNRPLMNREANKTVPEGSGLAASLVEAEEYARDVARSAPHLNVAILRLQELIGRDVAGLLSAHFDPARVASAIGFDPVMQFLHIDDAVAAVSFAAELELAGVYNVASRGVIRLSQLLARAGRSSLWMPPIEGGPLASIAAKLGLPHIADGLMDRLRFGHALDTQKLEAAGWKPKADQWDCAVGLQR